MIPWMYTALPVPTGSHYAIWAVTLTQRLFLAHTKSTSDEAATLLGEAMSKLSQDRLDLYLGLRAEGTVTIVRENIPRGDRRGDGQHIGSSGTAYLEARA